MSSMSKPQQRPHEFDHLSIHAQTPRSIRRLFEQPDIQTDKTINTHTHTHTHIPARARAHCWKVGRAGDGRGRGLKARKGERLGGLEG